MNEPMSFAKLDGERLYHRCGNCMEPYRVHRPRQSAAPTCPGGGFYREATEEELEAGYAAAFPNGPPEPITLKIGDPADVERAREIIGDGGAALMEALGKMRP